MGGLWSRIKTWVSGDVIYSADVDAEFDNVITNQVPDKFDNWSHTTTQMQIQESPTDSGGNPIVTPQPGLSLANELQRVRYIISKITGQTYWYQNPPRSLAVELSSDSVSCYLPFDGLLPSSSSSISDLISRGAIINAVSRSSADISTSNLSSAVKKFGNFSYQLSPTTMLGFDGKYSSNDSGSVSMHFQGLNPSDYLAFNPLMGIYLYLDSSGFLNAKVRKASCTTEGSKDTLLVTGSVNRSGSTSFSHVAMSYVMNSLNGASADYLKLYYNGSSEGTQQTNVTIPSNYSNSGAWFFGCKPNDPVWSKFSAMKNTPDGETTNPWTATSVGAPTVSASNGVLSLKSTDTTANSVYYTRTTNIDITNMTVEFKFKMNSDHVLGNATGPGVVVQVDDFTANRSCKIFLESGYITYESGGSGTNTVSIPIKNDWNLVRVVFSGSPDPTVKIYVNGVLKAQSKATNTSSGSSFVRFGIIPGGPSTVTSASFEYMAYSGVSATAPVTGDALGYVDDIGMSITPLSDSTVSSLSTTQFNSVYNRLLKSLPVIFDQLNISPLDGSSITFTAATYSVVTVTNVDGIRYIQADGQEEFLITCSGYAVAGANPFSVAISIDGDYDGEAAIPHLDANRIVASVENPFFVQRKIKPSQGIHSVKLVGLSSGVNATVVDTRLYIERLR